MTAGRHFVVQVTCCRGNKKKVGCHHGEDEEEEETVVTPADTPVEEKAVVVIVLDAHLTQLAVFSVVRLKQLTVWAEPMRALVVLHQVSDTGEPRICICSVQCPGVLSQNLTEQTKD